MLGTLATAIRNLEISNNYTELNGANQSYSHYVDRNGSEISNLRVINNVFLDSGSDKYFRINTISSAVYANNYGKISLGWEGYKVRVIDVDIDSTASIDNTRYAGYTKVTDTDGLVVFGRKGSLTVASQEGDSTTLGNLFSVYGRYLDSHYPTMDIGDSKWQWGTDAPTSGTYNQGDIVWNISPSAGGYIGWVCVVGGTPGTWKGFGAIAS